MKIKVLQYNILNGLCSEEKPYALDVNRKDAFLETVISEDPDILTICEASCRSFVRKSENYESSIEEMLQADNNGNKFRGTPAVITRFDVEHKNMSENFRKFIRAEVCIENRKIHLDVVHPRPELDERCRNEFFSKAIKSGNKPYILSGDFNSLSPQDSYNLEKLTRGYQRFMGEEAGKKKVEDIIKMDAMRPLFSECLIDTYKKIRMNGDFTVPTDWRNKNKDSAVRLDYIFCSNDFKIIDAGIIKNKLTENASDHYPTYAVLEI